VVNPNPSFWRGRRVLLTGHTGFKGAWTALWLENLGAEVHGLALAPPSEPSLFALACDLGQRDRRVDIRDCDAVLSHVRDICPDIVIHMAAQSLVRPSYRDPVATYAVNVMGLVHLLEAVRQTPSIRAIVNVTSDKCYENREWLWAYREDEPMGGYDPYSSSKGCAELVTSAWRRSFWAADGAPALASARAGNVIGGGDWALDRIVPDCVRAFSAGEIVTLRNPSAVRPWQHVLEPVCGYLLLAERLAERGMSFAEGWNFGPSEAAALPVAEVVRILACHWEGATWATDPGPQLHEAAFLKIDASKAKARLGWYPRLTIDDALRWTAQWHCRHALGEKAADLCREQIIQFQEQGQM